MTIPISSSQTSSHEHTDAELVDLAANGDTQAFDQLVTRYRGKVYALAVNMVRSEADAWDLAQEAFIKAWKALPRFKREAGFYTWLYRITHNVCYDWMRRQRLREGEEFDDMLHADQIAAHAPTAPRGLQRPDQAATYRELGAEITAAIDQLSQDHRIAILLREVEGLSYEEIAEITDSSIGTVMSRLFYARKKLQSTLKKTYESIR
jgi:RNA polymerase sigma-70 factor (ECF subfamily)